MPVLMIPRRLPWQSVRRLANRIHLALNIVVAGLLAAVTFVLSSLLALSARRTAARGQSR
jgi:hypothetical protein